jgi:hypothetical protein
MAMAWGSVTVTGYDGQDVYINGQYGQSAGKSPGPFLVEYGNSVFETLDARHRVTASAKATVDHDNPAAIVAFERFNTPKPVA